MRQLRSVLFLLLSVLFGTLLTAVPAHAQQASPSSVEGVHLKSELDRILNSSEFRPPSESEGEIARAVKWTQNQWEHFRKWFGNLWNRLFKISGGVGSTMSGIQYLFMGAFIGLGLILLYRLIVLALERQRQLQAEARPLYEFTEEITENLDDQTLRNEVERWIREGDFRLAYRALYLLFLSMMDSHGILEFQRSRTNGEYLLALRKKRLPVLADLLRPVLLAFDLRWYGKVETTRDDVETLQKNLNLFVEKLQESSQSQAAVGVTPASEGV